MSVREEKSSITDGRRAIMVMKYAAFRDKPCDCSPRLRPVSTCSRGLLAMKVAHRGRPGVEGLFPTCGGTPHALRPSASQERESHRVKCSAMKAASAPANPPFINVISKIGTRSDGVRRGGTASQAA